jgi:hypothetical protein
MYSDTLFFSVTLVVSASPVPVADIAARAEVRLDDIFNNFVH